MPHLLSIVMNWLGYGGDVEGLSFHIWDGLFKFLIFIGYIVGIAFMPDIRRVFCYHGAEHKTIHAYESGEPVTPEAAARFSRLHPRCGTTFLLFVMSIAILLHTVLVPLLLLVWTPESAVAKHAVTLLFKLLLDDPHQRPFLRAHPLRRPTEKSFVGAHPACAGHVPATADHAGTRKGSGRGRGRRARRRRRAEPAAP